MALFRDDFEIDINDTLSTQNRRLAERVTQLERAVVLLMSEHGLSMRKISDTTGIPYSDVRYWLKGRR